MIRLINIISSQGDNFVKKIFICSFSYPMFQLFFFQPNWKITYFNTLVSSKTYDRDPILLKNSRGKIELYLNFLHRLIESNFYIDVLMGTGSSNQEIKKKLHCTNQKGNKPTTTPVLVLNSKKDMKNHPGLCFYLENTCTYVEYFRMHFQISNCSFRNETHDLLVNI